jgi:hypothetical protein
MSVQVANVNLNAATVGTVGTLVSFAQLLPPPTLAQQMRPQDHADKVAHLLIFNETGCLLTIALPESRQTKTLPAGRWLNLPVPPHEVAVTYLVTAVATGVFSSLLADFYWPGEPVEDLGVLGNSPIGVSGAVSTAGSGGTTFIKNDANAPATSIIESTPNDQGSSSTSINNDGSGFWQVLSANVLRKIVNVVRGNATTGKATVTLGDSGDTSITTLYGTIGTGSVVPASTVTSPVWLPTAGGTIADAAKVAFKDANHFIGHALHGTSVELTLEDDVNTIAITSVGGVDISNNIVWDGSTNRFIDASGKAMQLTINNGFAAYPAYRESTNTPATGGAITFSTTQALLRTDSAGGGAAGFKMWEGTTDPAANAAEGDVWIGA